MNQRIMRSSLAVFFALLIWLSQGMYVCAAEGDLELLVVIDGSHSMSKEAEDIRGLLKILYQWMKVEPRIHNIEYIIFRDEAKVVDYDNVVNMIPGGYTNISAGIKLADEKVEAAIANGKKLNVLMISDMMASIESGYTWNAAEEEQDTVNELFKSWDERCEKGEMNYIVLTWKDQDGKSLQQMQNENREGEETISEFCCMVPNRDKVCWIKQPQEEGQESVLSCVQLVGNMMQNVLETLGGLEMKRLDCAFSSVEGDLALSEFCEAYVIMGNSCSLCLVEEEEEREIEGQEIEKVRIYHLGMKFNKVLYRMRTDDIKQADCFVFYVPKPETCTYIEPMRPEAGIELQLICSFKDEYAFDYLLMPLKAAVYCKGTKGDESMLIKELEMKEVEENPGNFKASMCLEGAEYEFCVETADGQVVAKVEEYVRKGAEKRDDAISEHEEEKNSFALAYICGGGIIIAALLGAIIICVRRRRMG